MSLEYELYHRPTKEYIDLGKWLMAKDVDLSWESREKNIRKPLMLRRTYQLPKERLEQFISSHPGELEIYPDSQTLPADTENGWVRVDSWRQANPERFVWRNHEYQSLEVN